MIFLFPYRDESDSVFVNYEKLINETRLKAIQQRMKELKRMEEYEKALNPITDSVCKKVESCIEREMQIKEKEIAKNCHIEIHNDGETVECCLYYNDNLVMRSEAKSDDTKSFNFPMLAKKALEDMFPHLKEER